MTLIYLDCDIKTPAATYLTRSLLARTRSAVVAGTAQAPVIDLRINSGGGWPEAGFCMYNALKGLPNNAVFDTHNEGKCDSAALYPFLAAPLANRTCSPNSQFLMHETEYTLTSSERHTIAAHQKAIQQLKDIHAKMIAILTKETSMDERTVRRLWATNTVITPQQALQYGIVSAIVHKSRASDDIVHITDFSKVDD